MQYLYTNNPDKHCHKIKGVYGRPVHTCHQAELLAKGWVKNADKLTKESNGQEEAKEAKKEEGVLTRKELAKSLGVPIVDDNGKPRHYKLIQGDIDKAQANEHNESQTSGSDS